MTITRSIILLCYKVAEQHTLTYHTLMSRQTNRRITEARWAAFAALRDELRLSHAAIARHFKLTRGAVHHGLKRWNELKEINGLMRNSCSSSRAP